MTSEIDATTSRGQEAMRPTLVRYEAAWCLVRLLLADPAYSAAFSRYLEGLHAGAPEPDAWRSTVGLLPAEKLEADYRSSLVPLEVSTLRTKVTIPRSAPGAVRAMAPGEGLVLFARLRDWSTPEGRLAANADLDAAIHAGDTGPEIAATRAGLIAAAGNFEEAEGVVRAGITASPEDRRLWNALGWLILARGGSDTKARLATIEGELEGADTAAEIDLVAHVRAAKDNLDAALAEEKRALALDPNCVECLVAAASFLARKGLYREALKTGTMALTFARESHVSANFLRSMDGWRGHAAEEKDPAQNPPPVPHADAVLAVLRGRFGECFGPGPSAAGEVELQAKVNARGEVTGVVPHASSLAAPVVDCLEGVLLHARFPAPGVNTSLDVPVSTKGR